MAADIATQQLFQRGNVLSDTKPVLNATDKSNRMYSFPGTSTSTTWMKAEQEDLAAIASLSEGREACLTHEDSLQDYQQFMQKRPLENNNMPDISSRSERINLPPIHIKETSSSKHSLLRKASSQSRKKKKKRSKHYKEVMIKYFSDDHYSIRKNVCDASKFGKYLHVQRDPNGGALVLHAYVDELSRVKKEYVNDFVQDFFRILFHEPKSGQAEFVMGIVHGAAAHIPELVSYFEEKHPQLVVKSEHLGKKSDIETLRMQEFCHRVRSTYVNGTFRSGPLLQFSLVGTVDEEVGGYFPDVLDMLERDPFLNMTLPWGDLSVLNLAERKFSNDGPIMWIRPGEQVVPTTEMPRSPSKRRRVAVNELQNLQYLPRVSEPRETLVEDRTRCHADHVGHGLDRQTTAAVGVLKAVHTDNRIVQSRIVKDVVAFQASDFQAVSEKLRLDLHEPPVSQCIKWMEDAQLNQLHREGVQYSKISLYDNDIYFIPRNVCHQFKTRSACSSVAWHIRLKQYYPELRQETSKIC